MLAISVKNLLLVQLVCCVFRLQLLFNKVIFLGVDGFFPREGGFSQGISVVLVF